MRYRALDAAGDYQFGRAGLFLQDNNAAVAQALKTRLKLWAGEWFLDADEGTPYHEQILGYSTASSRDQAVRARILDTPGVVELVKYSSSVGADRKFVVAATVSTIYGTATITLEL